MGGDACWSLEKKKRKREENEEEEKEEENKEEEEKEEVKRGERIKWKTNNQRNIQTRKRKQFKTKKSQNNAIEKK